MQHGEQHVIERHGVKVTTPQTLLTRASRPSVTRRSISPKASGVVSASFVLMFKSAPQTASYQGERWHSRASDREGADMIHRRLETGYPSQTS